MEVEIRKFQGIILKLKSVIIGVIKNGLPTEKSNIQYMITLYIQDRDAIVDLKNVRPEEIKILKEQSDYIKELEKFKRGEY